MEGAHSSPSSLAPCWICGGLLESLVNAFKGLVGLGWFSASDMTPNMEASLEGHAGSLLEKQVAYRLVSFDKVICCLFRLQRATSLNNQELRINIQEDSPICII
jgi:hypothetical protein